MINFICGTNSFGMDYVGLWSCTAFVGSSQLSIVISQRLEFFFYKYQFRCFIYQYSVFSSLVLPCFVTTSSAHSKSTISIWLSLHTQRVYSTLFDSKYGLGALVFHSLTLTTHSVRSVHKLHARRARIPRFDCNCRLSGVSALVLSVHGLSPLFV